MKKWLPPFCVAAGIVAGVLRGIHLGSGYEAETQLALAGNPLLWVITGLSVAFALVVLAVSRKAKPVKELDFVQCFRCVHSGYKTIGVICGVLLLLCGATGIYLYTLEQKELQLEYLMNGMVPGSYIQLQAIPNLILWVLSLVAGVCLVGILSMQSKIEVTPKNGYWLIPPMLWSAFLLIACYLDHSAIPSVSLFAFWILACLMMMLAFRDFAAFLYGKKIRVISFLFGSACAVYLSLMEVVSQAWSFLFLGNILNITTLTVVKLVLLAAGCLFLLCNQRILLSNLEYQASIIQPEEENQETKPLDEIPSESEDM